MDIDIDIDVPMKVLESVDYLLGLGPSSLTHQMRVRSNLGLIQISVNSGCVNELSQQESSHLIVLYIQINLVGK